jgi:hypothetical protein
MARIELPLWVIVAAGWLLLVRRGGEHRSMALVRLCVASTCAWLAEQTLIRAHGYHFYPQDWIVTVGTVPVVLSLWWGLSITTAYSITRPDTAPRRAGLLAAALVLADAAIVLPWLVAADACRFNGPGPFDVPPIGLVGPAITAYAIGPVLRYLRQRTWQSTFTDALAAVATVHAAVLIGWHAGLKFLEAPWPGWATTALAIAIASLATWVLVPRATPARRTYGVVRSFGLGPVAAGLARAGVGPWHWIWAAIVALPYMTAQRGGDRGSSK